MWILRIEPGGPVSLPLQGDDLATFRAVARGVYVERALAEQRFAEVRAYDRFIVAYADTPGQPSETIVLETKRGLLVAAFTTEGAALRFRAAVPAEAQPSVRFAIRDGATLFGDLPADAQGVIVNGRGPESFHVDRAACRAVAEAR